MKREQGKTHALIGNSFPINLIARRAVITVVERQEFLRQIRGCVIHSFWGHANTLAAAQDFAGVDLTPAVPRPALTLSERNLPVLNGVEFERCWILTPVYACALRPEIGREMPIDQIDGWRIKKLEWSIDETD